MRCSELRKRQNQNQWCFSCQAVSQSYLLIVVINHIFAIIQCQIKLWYSSVGFYLQEIYYRDADRRHLSTQLGII